MILKKYFFALCVALSIGFISNPVAAKTDQIECLAKNIYHEARGQSKVGQIAVANVVLNRVESKRFPNTVCSVINQRTKRVCQFAWKCGSPKPIREKGAWERAKELAEEIYNKGIEDNTNGALFFRVGSYHKRMTTKIGAHIFYK